MISESSWKDRINLCLYNLIEFLPNLLRDNFKTIDRLVRNSSQILLADTVYEEDGCRWTVVGPESFDILRSEPWMPRFLHVEERGIFLDVGAHFGKYTIPVAKKAEKVISVEAAPKTFRVLKGNIKLNHLKNVDAVNLAAWNKSDHLQFFVKTYAGTNSLKHSGSHVERTIMVRAEKLDKILDALKIDWVDWVKVDVEGAELEALEGLSEHLAKCRPRLIVEVWYENTREFRAFLRKFNYGFKHILTESPYADYYFCWPMGVISSVNRQGESQNLAR